MTQDLRIMIGDDFEVVPRLATRWFRKRVEEGKVKLAEHIKLVRARREAAAIDADERIMVAHDACEEGRALEAARILGDDELVAVLEAQ